MKTRVRLGVLSVTLVGSALAVPVAHSEPLISQAGRGVVAPAGFAATAWAATPVLPTTLTWGPDTGDGVVAAAGERHGTLLYVGGVSGNPISCQGCGQVVAFTDERTLVTPKAGSTAVAEGFNAVLGVAFGPDETMYVSDNLNSRGRVLAARDADGDGYFETKRVLLKNIPNGRHQTNGLTFGPDGKLYLANGNATDDGIECGPDLDPETQSDEVCPDPERKPWTGSIIRVNPAWSEVDLLSDVEVDADARYAADGLDDESVLVAQGFRNIYDVDFNPARANEIWTPMNGPDNPSGSEPIYGLPIDDERTIQVGTDPVTGEPVFERSPIIEDAGFPSCVYDPHWNYYPQPEPYFVGGHNHSGNPEPADNLNAAVTARFGDCVSRLDRWHRPRAVLQEGHEGTSGLAFERGGNFPARYDGDLFIAEWGSLWNLNSLQPNGHKILRLNVNPDGTVSGRQQEFFTSPLPIDLTFGPNGFMYVADMTGQIYEVRFVSDAAAAEEVVVTITDPTNKGYPVFSPAVVNVVQGQTVRWVNNDNEAHNVACVQKVSAEWPTNGNPLPPCAGTNSPTIPPGGEFRRTFDGEVATYAYHSNVGTHGDRMRGQINVAPVER